MTGRTIHTQKRKAYLGLGSNMGDKAANIKTAISHIAAADAVIAAQSPLYQTAPWGNENQDWFVNACVLIETTLQPRPLLDLCLGIEHLMGRERLLKWGPRLIDIDILLFEGQDILTERLILPHPHLLQRAFVLVPLNDIAPNLVIGGTTVREALSLLDSNGVIPLC